MTRPDPEFPLVLRRDRPGARWLATAVAFTGAALLLLLGLTWGLQFTLLKIATGSRLSELGPGTQEGRQ